MIKRLRDLLWVIKIFKNWPIRIIEFIGLYPAKKIKYRLRNGLVYYVRKNQIDVVHIIECFRKHVYDKHKKIGYRDTVIDIGANLGAFSIYAAKIAKGGMVYSFEPEEENFNLLKENIEVNKLLNIRAFKLGVAGKTKRSKLFLSEGKGQHSIYVPRKPTGENVIVQFLSLQQIFEDNNINRCDFLKMDCEGAEYEILFNCPKKVLNRIKCIAMEFHDFDRKYDHLKMKRYLNKNGFSTIVSDEVPSNRIGLLYAIRGD